VAVLSAAGRSGTPCTRHGPLGSSLSASLACRQSRRLSAVHVRWSYQPPSLPHRLRLAVVTLPHGPITTLSGEATLSRRLSHHRMTLVARLGRALVAEHQAASSLRVQQLLMRLRVAAHVPTPLPPPTLRAGFGVALGAPLPPAHSPSPPSRSLSCAPCRTQTRELRWHVPRGPVHSVGLPSAGRGSTGCSRPPSAASLRCAASVFPPADCGGKLDGLASQGREARGSLSRRARRAAGEASSSLSATRPLLETSLLRMASLRGMLLTSERGR